MTSTSASTARVLQDSIVTGSFPHASYVPTVFETDDILTELNYPMSEGEWRLEQSQDAQGKIRLRLKWTRARIQGIDVRMKYSLTFSIYTRGIGSRHEVIETEQDCIDWGHQGEVAWSINRPNFTGPGYGGVTSVASALSLSCSLKVRNCDKEISGAAKDYAKLIETQHPNDVHLSFRSARLSLWANKRNLLRVSPYFLDLLDGNFLEGSMKNFDERGGSRKELNKQTASDLDHEKGDEEEQRYREFEDSDDEVDDHLISKFQKRITSTSDPTGSCPARYHQIPISSAAYSTYAAVLIWLHSSSITFATLSSSYSARNTEEGPRSIATMEYQLNKNSSSPKSVYRLAQFLSLEELSALALLEIQRQLTPQNVALELFGDVAGVFEEVRKVEMDFLMANFDKVKLNGTLDLVAKKSLAGEIPYYPSTSMELMKRLHA